MTLNTTPPLIDYLENGVTLVHPVPFQFQGAEEIVCFRELDGVETPLINGGDYVVSGGDGATGSVTKTNGGVLGAVFRIKRVTTRAQLTDYGAHDDFPAEVAELGLDRLAAVNQEQEIEVADLEDRALVVPPGEHMPQLPGPDDRLAKLLGFSSASGVRELVSLQALATALAPLLRPVLAAIEKGDPGGNILAIGLFTAASLLNVPLGSNVIRTSGYSVEEKGGALYQADAAVDAAYVAAHPRSSFISVNGRGFRLSRDQLINVQMFNAIGNNATADGPAFISAIAWCNENSIDGFGYGKGAPALYVPPAVYWMDAETLDFTHSIRFYGEGYGGAGGGASVLRWGPNTTGLRFQRADTFGEAGVLAPADVTTPGADGSIVHGLLLRGPYAGVEGEYHALRIRCHGVTAEQNIIEEWQGDGIHNRAGADADGGNANCFSFRRNLIRKCRKGIYIDGDNTNAGETWANDVSGNRQWGLHDSSFLGNIHNGIAEGCGLTAGSIPSIVSHGGNYYAVIADQEAGAATNPPTGAATDNAWWYYVSPGAPDAVRPAWFNGIAVRAGGPIRTDNNNARSVIIGFYTEIGQGPSQLVWPTLVLGGQHAAGIKGVSWLRHSDQGLQTDLLHVLNNAIFGPTLGFPASDGATFFDTTNTVHQLLFRYFVAGNTFYSGVIQSEVGQGMRIFGDPEIHLLAGSPAANTHIATIDADGLHIGPLGAGAAVYVGPDKVLGSQQPAIADVVGGAVQDTEARIAIAQMLAAWRNHGGIAT